MGTLKYSPPEFLLREEKDDVNAWRAITFYQLGGVLHDLIMRRSLFADFENPFARLVNAVQHESPRVESTTVPPSLVDLTRYCLLKRADTRLQLVSWKNFDEEQPEVDDIETIKSEIIRRNLAAQSEKGQARIPIDPQVLDAKLDGYCDDLQSACRVACIDDPSVFPPVEIRTVVKEMGRRQFFVQFEPSTPHCLTEFLRLEVVVEWIDSSSEVCQICSTTFTATAAQNPKDSCGGCDVELFKGIYAPDTARRVVTAALYRAVHGAQKMGNPVVSTPGRKQSAQ